MNKKSKSSVPDASEVAQRIGAKHRTLSLRKFVKELSKDLCPDSPKSAKKNLVVCYDEKTESFRFNMKK